MTMQVVRELMAADYRRYVADIMARHPIQERNRATYERFESAAQLGSMKCNVRLKGNRIDKGRVVLFTPDPTYPNTVQVWWQGCMCPALVAAGAVKAL